MAQTPLQPVGALGSVQFSILTQTQFQAVYGTGWVLCQGQSISGSALASLTGITTLPDCRGMSLRGKNNGRSDGSQNPDGDVALGTYQADNFASHTHVQNTHGHTVNDSGHGHGSWASDVSGPDADAYLRGEAQGANYPNTVISGTSNISLNNTTATNQNTGGNETRMRNITLNVFIRIN